MPYNAEPELFHYLKSVEILSIEQYGSENGTLLYSVEIDAETSEAGKAVLGDGGRMTRFVAVGEEGGSLRIFGDGTGP
jgi:hypothetical protein